MSRLIKNSSVLPIRGISSRYITRRMFSGLSRAIGTFNGFENILGAGPNPKQRQRNSERFPDQANLTNFFPSCTVALRNRHLSDIPSRENRFSREGISSNANLPF